MKYLRNIGLCVAVGVLALVSAGFASAGANVLAQDPFHGGFYGSVGYIGIWNLKNDLYVKKAHNRFQEVDGVTGQSYRVQYLTGGHDMRGLAAGLGVAGAYDVNSWLTLRADLYLSCRYRFVEATEYHYKITELDGAGALNGADEGKAGASRDSTFDSKGDYEISLMYWHVDLPVSARFNLPKSFYVETGVLLSYIVAANLEMSLISLDLNAYSAGAELGLLGAAGHRFRLGSRQLDIFGKFTFGLTPLLSDNVRNFVYQGVHLREWIVEVGAILWMF